MFDGGQDDDRVAEWLHDAGSAAATALGVLRELTRVARAVHAAAHETAVETARVLIESPNGHAEGSRERIAHQAACDSLVLAQAGVAATDRALDRVERAVAKLQRHEGAAQLDQGATRH